MDGRVRNRTTPTESNILPCSLGVRRLSETIASIRARTGARGKRKHSKMTLEAQLILYYENVMGFTPPDGREGKPRELNLVSAHFRRMDHGQRNAWGPTSA